MNQKVTLWKGIFFFVGTNYFFWFSSSLPGYSSMPRFINHSQEIDTSALHRLSKQENHLIVAKLFTKTNFLIKSFFST